MTGKVKVLRKEKIGIVGGGNVGKALALALSSKHYDVELVCNKRNGIQIGCNCEFSMMGDFGDVDCLIHTVEDVEKLSDNLDVIIMATKSYDTLKVLSKCLSKLSENGCIVTIHNVFCIDKISKIIPNDKSICAYLDFNCISDNNRVQVTNFNGITLGIYDTLAFEKLEKVKRIFKSFTQVHIAKDIVGFILGRNILNGAISMLGAISGMKLGDILLDRNGRYLFTKIICEAVGVIKRFRINIVPYNDQLDYYQFVEDKRYRNKMIKILRQNNKDVRSSALSDIENGRKTEISFVLGLILEYSQKHIMETKFITAIYEMVKEIEEGVRIITPDAFYDKKLLKLEK